MTYKIVDIADEIIRELNEPTDINIAGVAFWLRRVHPLGFFFFIIV